jgi:nitroimidazol reductase NimA-like FMN-containing flavoprotein (pyridoxamine 5'-phosphate oxidase superfamily)
VSVIKFMEINEQQLSELSEFSKEFIKQRFMAVVGSVFQGEPRTFTCWYMVVEGKIYWKSRTESEHSQAFAEKNQASLCVYDHEANYPDDKTGVQVLGKVEKVIDRIEMEKIVEKMAEKFGEKVKKKNHINELCDPNTSSTFYSFTPTKWKLVSKSHGVHMENYLPFNL